MKVNNLLKRLPIVVAATGFAMGYLAIVTGQFGTSLKFLLSGAETLFIALVLSIANSDDNDDKK